jgi:predicted SnoaL-like aldol condensation-catalyzing enzyme
LVAPDVIGTQVFSEGDQAEARILYRQLLTSSPSNKHGCRRYVKQSFHKHIPRTTLHYDVATHGDMVFQITTHDIKSRPETQSYLSVTTLTNHDTFKQSIEASTKHFLADRSRFVSARNSVCDLGQMTAVGVLRARTGGCLIETKAGTVDTAFSRGLPDLCRQAAAFANDKFPGLLSTINHLESAAGITRPQYMGGKDGVSSSMAVSVDLANATHYDVNDASMGFVVFAESKPHTTSHWNFVLPNVLVKFNNHSYHGLALKLHHGACIHFDGRIIRHGTSMHNRFSKDEHTMGFFWAASSKAFATGITTSSTD